ncbi:MAG: hypothetical protein PHR16_00425 [Methylovulum sp.]|nr:hypothetical protein [Methylovulum sp.]
MNGAGNLIQISTALSSEKNINSLLEMILQKTKTNSGTLCRIYTDAAPAVQNEKS